MTFSKYFQFLFKELNKNKSKASKVFFTIFVSLLIFSSVIILKNSIENEIKNNSRIFLGGDLELSTKNKPLNDEFLDQLADRLLDKLLEKCSQPEWHVRRSDDFVNNLSGIIAFKENEEERMLGEMSKLMTLMVMYEEKGQQDKADLMQEKVDQLNKKLNNL